MSDTPTSDTATKTDVLAGIKEALATLIQAVDMFEQSIGETAEEDEGESPQEPTEETSTEGEVAEEEKPAE